MNYTREPIIETIITPKEGCKLVVRNSKGVNGEEHFVEALEVVSFGNAIFFRSTERPKSFLVPVTDFEVVELKETKMVLKSASIEKAIKIGGGKSEEIKPQRRKRVGKNPKPQMAQIPKPIAKPLNTPTEKGGGQDDETQVSSSILRKLFPPPPNLIKERLNHIKSPEKIDENISKEIVKEETKQEIITDQPKEETRVEEKKIEETIIVEEKKENDPPKEEIAPDEEKKDK